MGPRSRTNLPNLRFSGGRKRSVRWIRTPMYKAWARKAGAAAEKRALQSLPKRIQTLPGTKGIDAIRTGKPISAEKLSEIRRIAVSKALTPEQQVAGVKRIVSEIDPRAKLEQYKYDPRGHLTKTVSIKVIFKDGKWHLSSGKMANAYIYITKDGIIKINANELEREIRKNFHPGNPEMNNGKIHSSFTAGSSGKKWVVRIPYVGENKSRAIQSILWDDVRRDVLKASKKAGIKLDKPYHEWSEGERKKYFDILKKTKKESRKGDKKARKIQSEWLNKQQAFQSKLIKESERMVRKLQRMQKHHYETRIPKYPLHEILRMEEALKTLRNTTLANPKSVPGAEARGWIDWTLPKMRSLRRKQRAAYKIEKRIEKARKMISAAEKTKNPAKIKEYNAKLVRGVRVLNRISSDLTKDTRLIQQGINNTAQFVSMIKYRGGERQNEIIQNNQ
ncbi:MAG: hypothetical protein NTZ73_04565 [Candidatus Diapherotrites archaeon]|nr:hypothetical protein [Candidatus Diapherotrites archaeon]